MDGDDGGTGAARRPELPRAAPTARGAAAPERATPADSPSTDSEEPAPDAAPRPERRAPTPGFVEDVAAAVSAEPDPVDPADPVVSANATGNAATAEPIPSATASAPTRPTYRAEPDDTSAPPLAR